MMQARNGALAVCSIQRDTHHVALCQLATVPSKSACEKLHMLVLQLGNVQYAQHTS